MTVLLGLRYPQEYLLEHYRVTNIVTQYVSIVSCLLYQAMNDCPARILNPSLIS